MFKYLLVLLLICTSALADEFGLRLNSVAATTDTALWEFPTGGNGTNGYIEGKIIHAVYDWEPHPNFFLEGGLGYRSWNDVFEYSSMAYEVSPGLRVAWHALVFRLSEGLSYMPENSFNPVTWEGYQQLDFVTHITLGLKDPKTGIGIYLDRSHYSNGSAYNNPSLNYVGFMILFPIN